MLRFFVFVNLMLAATDVAPGVFFHRADMPRYMSYYSLLSIHDRVHVTGRYQFVCSLLYSNPISVIKDIVRSSGHLPLKLYLKNIVNLLN